MGQQEPLVPSVSHVVTSVTTFQRGQKRSSPNRKGQQRKGQKRKGEDPGRTELEQGDPPRRAAKAIPAVIPARC